MSRFTVAGISQIETIVKVKKIPVDFAPVSSNPDTIFTAAGGDAYNESLALEWLGDEVDFLSMVGRGQDMNVFNPADRKETISTEYILPILDATPAQVILYDNDRRQQIFEDIKGLREANYDMSMVPPLVARSDMLVLSNANFCRPFLKTAEKYKVPVAVNIHEFSWEREHYNRDFLEAASILYISDDTIAEDPFDVMKTIAEKYGPEIILLGQGSEGLIIFDRKRNMHIHYDSVKTNEVVNTAGAGNALFACFLHYYQETKDSINAIKNALLFASYKIGFMGTSNGFMTVEQVAQWRDLIWGTGEKI